MGNVGNLSGIGKMENSSGGNKLYRVTITQSNSSYIFYSSVAINNRTELKSYLESKINGVRVFSRLEGGTTQSRYQVSLPYLIKHYDATNVQITADNYYANFSSGSYTGGGRESSSYRLQYTNLNVSSSEE